MPSQSREQERAAYAWAKVGDSPADEYVSLAKAAPALIMTNGLMQTLAFYRKKGDKKNSPSIQLLDHILGWLARELGGAPTGAGAYPTTASFSAAMEALHGASTDLYMRATEEALAILMWIRQLADARKQEAASGDRS